MFSVCFHSAASKKEDKEETGRKGRERRRKRRKEGRREEKGKEGKKSIRCEIHANVCEECVHKITQWLGKSFHRMKMLVYQEKKIDWRSKP